jgi:GNAT superfamily N-acetyltransferase
MIDELIVHPQAQAIGVGSEILAEVRRWATAHQCEALESQVLPGNRAAKNFFERVGMKTRKMRVSADLI